MTKSEFRKVVSEHLDIFDEETRNIVLAVSEADQNQVLSSLASKLYDNIVKKVDNIDFGSIPNSKGDITKVENYTQLMQCVELMESIMQEYKQDISPILTVKESIENIKSRTDIWEKAYTLNIELPIVLYNTIVLAIVSSISFLISSTIEFVATPGETSFEIAVNSVSLKKTKSSLLFKNLERFNKSCTNGELDKAIEAIMDGNKNNLLGSTAVPYAIAAIAITTIVVNIIPILRELIFFFYNSRQSLSDYFAIQADLLQMNADNITYNSSKPTSEKKKIQKKQMKVVDKFRKISTILAVKCKKAEKDAEKEAKTMTKKYKYNEISDELPDSVASSQSSIF